MKKKLCALLLLLILVLGLLPTTALAAEPASGAAVQWKNFRNSDSNMAITTAKTPRSAAEAELKWVTENSLQEDWVNPAPMLIVDNKLITTWGARLVQVSLETGEITGTGAMAGVNGAYGCAPLAYGGGMVFVPLLDGRVQAFDALTLQSLWISEDFGDQCATGLTYHDGYLYGSTWTWGNSRESFFCLSAADEDAGQAEETKAAVWTADIATGSYWSTPYVTDQAVVYGTDSGCLYSRDSLTGEEISCLELPGAGAQRTSIVYAEGRIYGGTSNGYLFSAALAEDGTLSDLKAVKDGTVSSITSSPVVYDGVVYYGAEKKVVAADAETLETLRSTSGGFVEDIAYGGAVQSSLLLSAQEQGTVYLYATQNCEPGGLYVIADDGAALTASVLYTPDSDKQQYNNTSPICGSDGTIYFRNDSGYLFAVGTWQAEYCPVSFQVSPSGASVTLRDSAGSAVAPARGDIYDLTAGIYTYTVSSGDESKSGTLVITDSYAANHIPQTITVTLYHGQGESPVPPAGTVTVSIRVADPKGETYLGKTYYTMEGGSTVYDLLRETGLNIQSTRTEYGVYIQGIEGLGEFDEGSDSGWMYRVNGVYPQVSASAMTLEDGDYVEWLYTRNLGEDIGGGFANTAKARDLRAAAGVDALISAIGTVTKDSKTAIEAARKAYDALTDAQKELVEMYGTLLAAEAAYAKLTAPLPFTDVAEDYWAVDAIRYVYELGLMNGTTGTAFSPEMTTSRGMIVTMLYRLEGAPQVTGGTGFADVPADMYCADAVKWAADNGIAGGYGGGWFGPNAPITREQLTAILYRYAAFKGYDVTARADLSWFMDTEKIGPLFRASLEWANAEGLVNGRANNTIDPQGRASRAQVAVILTRFLENA